MKNLPCIQLCTGLHIFVIIRCTIDAHYSKWITKDLQLFNKDTTPSTKRTYWSEIDPWLTDELYLHRDFEKFFNERAGECRDGLYPTVTIRQFMWGLKMKPMSKERWETCFDRRVI